MRERLKTFQEIESYVSDPRYWLGGIGGYENAIDGFGDQWHRDVVDQFCDVFPVGGLRVLDAGCGIGAYMFEFQKHGAVVTGVDLSAYAVGFCHGKGLRDVHRASLHHMPMLPDGEFDLVFSAEVLEHVPEALSLAAARELVRVAKPGGILYMQGQFGEGGPAPGDDDLSHVNIQPESSWIWWFTQAAADRGLKVRRLKDLELRLRAKPKWREYRWKFFFLRLEG